MVRTCFLLFLVGLDHGQTIVPSSFPFIIPISFHGPRAVKVELFSPVSALYPLAVDLPGRQDLGASALRPLGKKISNLYTDFGFSQIPKHQPTY